jgi:hypothetical protein
VNQANPVFLHVCGVHTSLLGPPSAPITSTFLAIAQSRARWASADGSHEDERRILLTLLHSVSISAGRATVSSAVSFAIIHEYFPEVPSENTLALCGNAGLHHDSPNGRRWLDAVFVKWATAIGPTSLQQHKDRLGIPLSRSGPPSAPHVSDMLGKAGDGFTELLRCVRHTGSHVQHFLQPCARVSCDVITTALSQRTQPG